MAEPTRKKLTASQEDYLEAVLHISRQHGAAQVRDIAERLSVSMPSVTGALRKLAGLELVNYTPYSTVTLSPLGRQRAETIELRHEILDRFLVELLGLDPGAAGDMACRMEHALDADSLRRLRALVDYATSGEGKPFLDGLRRKLAAIDRLSP